MVLRSGGAATARGCRSRSRVRSGASAVRFAGPLAAVVTLATVVVRPAFAAYPRLEEAVARAKVSSLTVIEAAGQVGVARATMASARLAPVGNPYLEATAGYKSFNLTTDGPVGVTTFFPVELHGQRGSRMEEAGRLTRWREINQAEATGRAIGEVIATYGSTLVAAARLEAAARAEADAQAEVAYFSARLQLGDSTIFDKSLAEAEAARYAQTRAEAAVRVAQLRANLAELMGLATVEAPAADASSSPPDLRGEWTAPAITRSIQTSPIYLAYSAEAAYWDASRERVSAERNPPVNLMIFGGPGAGGDAKIGGGLSWTLPVFRRNQGDIARAEAERDRALTYQQILQLTMEARLRGAHEVYRTSRDATAEQDKKGIPAAERMVDAAQASFKAGKGELLRVFIARRDLAMARGRRLDLVETAWHAYGTLAALKGQLP